MTGEGKSTEDLALEEIRQASRRSLNRLAKWRTVLTGWMLGTRPKGDPEGDAVRDLQEARLLLRVEVTALVGLLLKKGFFSEAEFANQVRIEADYLNESFEKRFPGITVTEEGLTITEQAKETMRGWKQ